VNAPFSRPDPATLPRITPSPPPPQLTDRFFAAAALANEVHGGRRRLGTQIPYAAQLMIVAGLVLEDGGDETQAIAALLHDAAEDGGDRPMLDRIRAEFGDAVADIVEACSDTLDSEDPRSWRERKARDLAHLPDVTDQGTLRVALADKVHDARSIVRDYRAEGHTLWSASPTRPSTTSSGTTARCSTSSARGMRGPLVEDLRHALAELEDLAAHDASVTGPLSSSAASVLVSEACPTRD
jgi:hypothetical protein